MKKKSSPRLLTNEEIYDIIRNAGRFLDFPFRRSFLAAGFLDFTASDLWKGRAVPVRPFLLPLILY